MIVSLEGFWTAEIPWGNLSLAAYRDGIFNEPIARQGADRQHRARAHRRDDWRARGRLVSLFVVRTTPRLGRVVDGAIKFPATLSHIVLAVGFVLALGGEPFNLAGTILILMLAYLALYFPQTAVAADSAVGAGRPRAARGLARRGRGRGAHVRTHLPAADGVRPRSRLGAALRALRRRPDSLVDPRRARRTPSSAGRSSRSTTTVSSPRWRRSASSSCSSRATVVVTVLTLTRQRRRMPLLAVAGRRRRHERDDDVSADADATPRDRARSSPCASSRRPSAARTARATRAIDDVSLDVTPGEFVVLLGPSGCGKTTLLRSIAGLEQPDAGEIEIRGKTVFSSARGHRRPAGAAAARDDLPVVRALAAHDRVPERRLPAAGAAAEEEGDRRARRPASSSSSASRSCSASTRAR